MGGRSLEETARYQLKRGRGGQRVWIASRNAKHPRGRKNKNIKSQEVEKLADRLVSRAEGADHRGQGSRRSRYAGVYSLIHGHPQLLAHVHGGRGTAWRSLCELRERRQLHWATRAPYPSALP